MEAILPNMVDMLHRNIPTEDNGMNTQKHRLQEDTLPRRLMRDTTTSINTDIVIVDHHIVVRVDTLPNLDNTNTIRHHGILQGSRRSTTL
jgi:hypothetical protein